NFYKTLSGAAIGDVLTSIIATAAEANVNLFEYLTDLQRNREQVKADPGQWLPWVYAKRVAEAKAQ
ncbi:MAG: transposase, partial [Gammaproteobacteria bacterium]